MRPETGPAEPRAVTAGRADVAERDQGTDSRRQAGHVPAKLTVAVDRLRAKIGERQREGRIAPRYARQLDAAAAGLTAART
jgi:hypothetical protein